GVTRIGHACFAQFHKHCTCCGVASGVHLRKSLVQLCLPERDGPHEYHAIESLGILLAIQCYESRAPRVCEDLHALQTELAPHGFEVFNEAAGVQRGGVGYEGGATGTALVVEDQHQSCGERREVINEVRHAEPRPTVQY